MFLFPYFVIISTIWRLNYSDNADFCVMIFEFFFQKQRKVVVNRNQNSIELKKNLKIKLEYPEVQLKEKNAVPTR